MKKLLTSIPHVVYTAPCALPLPGVVLLLSLPPVTGGVLTPDAFFPWAQFAPSPTVPIVSPDLTAEM